jgi:hypothetical protein
MSRSLLCPAGRPWAWVAAAALAALLATPAAAETPRALIFTELGNPLSLVPGRKDGLRVSSFSIGYGAYSPGGGRWAVTAVGARDTAPTSPTLLITGTVRGMATVAVQNENLAGLGFGFSSSPTSLGINDRGEVAIGMQANNGTAADRVMIGRYRPATRLWDTVARQNNVIPGLEASVPGAVGERYSSTLAVADVLPDGRVGFTVRGTTGPLASDRDDFLLVEGNPVGVLAQTGVLVPQNQLGGGAQTLLSFERIGWVEPLGNWALRGPLSGGVAAQDEVFIVGGSVVMQEGGTVKGLPGTVATMAPRLFAQGQWLVRGTNSTGLRFLVANFTLRALQGAPVPGLEAIGNVVRIDAAAMNERGDLAYQLVTADPGTGSNRYWVVLERIGEPARVVVSGSTELDVGVSPRGPIFYGVPLGLDMGLGLSRNLLYFVCRTFDSNQLTAGDGVFVLRLPEPAAPLPRHGADAARAALVEAAGR